ncbi:DUF4190 domain-containing protein [Plantibacter sp. RU18]|uniref:DUF4190 domain-containing protein n=1 Tax=Plantibacter sp. RU18 TaxID=3158143 RepID=UPI003D36AA71
MSLTYEQFRGVLPDAQLRASFGLNLSDDEARALLADSDAAARYYGAWIQDPHRVGGVARTIASTPRVSGYAVAAFVLALVAIVGAVFQIGGLAPVIVGVMALPVAFTARADIKRTGQGGSSMVVAAIPLALVGTGLPIVAAILN